MLEAIKKLNRKETWIIVGITLLGLILRLWGTKHSFPFIFHPDEPALVRSATGLRFEANPNHFDWPHLHFYLNYIVYFLFIKFRGLLQALRLQGFLSAKFPLVWRDPLVFYFISRVFDAVIGAATAIPVFLTGKRLVNKKVGYLAALAITLMPLHVHVSHYALIDVPTAFWAAWAMYFSAKLFKGASLKDYILAGLFVGFSASTKYNGGLVAITVAAAHFLRVLKNKEKLLSLDNIKKPMLAGLLAALGFFIGTPYAALDYDTFSRDDSPVGAMWQFKNVGSVDPITHLKQFGGVLTTTLADDFGFVFTGLFLIFGIYTLIKRKDYTGWFILIPILFLFYYTSGFVKLRSHYFLTVYPFMAVASGYILYLILQKISFSWLRYPLLILIFAVPFFLSYQRSYTLSQKDTRILLYEWVNERMTILDHFVYNSSSLGPVAEKLSKDRSDKDVIKANLTGKKGYIAIYIEEEELESFYLGNNKESFVVEKYEKVHEIDATGRRGNHILIYRFDEIKTD
jgi:hypothetical protein